jgi:hypothetical protein
MTDGESKISRNCFAKLRENSAPFRPFLVNFGPNFQIWPERESAKLEKMPLNTSWSTFLETNTNALLSSPICCLRINQNLYFPFHRSIDTGYI